MTTRTHNDGYNASLRVMPTFPYGTATFGPARAPVFGADPLLVMGLMYWGVLLAGPAVLATALYTDHTGWKMIGGAATLWSAWTIFTERR
jgi:hypothetical protein